MNCIVADRYLSIAFAAQRIGWVARHRSFVRVAVHLCRTVGPVSLEHTRVCAVAALASRGADVPQKGIVPLRLERASTIPEPRVGRADDQEGRHTLDHVLTVKLDLSVSHHTIISAIVTNSC